MERKDENEEKKPEKISNKNELDVKKQFLPNVPDPLANEILNFLNITNILNASQVSKKWNEITSEFLKSLKEFITKFGHIKFPLVSSVVVQKTLHESSLTLIHEFIKTRRVTEKDAVFFTELNNFLKNNTTLRTSSEVLRHLLLACNRFRNHSHFVECMQETLNDIKDDKLLDLTAIEARVNQKASTKKLK